MKKHTGSKKEISEKNLDNFYGNTGFSGKV